MKHLISLLAAVLLIPIAAGAQTKWYNPLDYAPVVQGQGWSELNGSYFRLPAHAEGKASDAVWRLSHNSAGLSVVFRTDSPEIIVKHKVKGGMNMLHMPSTGVSGCDLYAYDMDGSLHWLAPDFPPRYKADSVNVKFSNISYLQKDGRGYEYHLYLPLYNTPYDLKIGIPREYDLTFAAPRTEKPIVIYGTSITQGACASRPGNCWTAIVERELEHPVVNLGFSGSAKMEPQMFDLIAETDALMYIIDCLPNMMGDIPSIREKAVYGVKTLRGAHPHTPILLLEHSGYVGENASLAKSNYTQANAQLRLAWSDLVSEGITELYYGTAEEVGLGMDGMVEGTHPNDLGMRQIADGVEKLIRKVLHEDTSVYAPIRHNRDPYIWMERHEQVLSACREKKPSVIVIGDSITHNWGGDPVSDRARSQKSWDELWKGRSVVNLGFGYDMVENVLWRIYHGELDGYEAGTILILIGTNNLSRYESIDKIAAGINQIVDAAALRQPGAKIYVCSVLPRAGKEDVVRNLNETILARLHSDKASFIDVQDVFLGKDGKIVTKYFSPDGIHPVAKGYEALSEFLSERIF